MREKPIDSYQKIIDWLKKFGNKDFFFVEDLATALNLKRGTVEVFVHRKVKKGYFEKGFKNERVAYRMIVEEIPIEISKGELSQTVFDVLKQYSRSYPTLFFSQSGILEKVRKKIPKASLDSVHAVLYRWYGSGFLEKNNIGNNKGYKLKDPTVDKRPVTVS